MTAQLYLQKAWKVCWRVLPVRTEIPSAKPKSAAFWVNTDLSISSMLRHRNSLAGSPTRRSSWNMIMMTCSMRKFGKRRYCWESCRDTASVLENEERKMRL